MLQDSINEDINKQIVYNHDYYKLLSIFSIFIRKKNIYANNLPHPESILNILETTPKNIF